MSDEKENKAPSRSDGITAGAVLICLGAFFILGRYFHFLRMSTLWPLFMMIPVIPLGASLARDFRKNVGVMVPITILTFYTVYYLWLNFTSWGNVAHTWPNFILAPGLGFLAAALFSRNRGYLVPGGILVIVALAFYMMFIVRIDWSLLSGGVLIVIGVFVLLARGKRRE